MQQLPSRQFNRPLKQVLGLALLCCIGAIAASCTATSTQNANPPKATPVATVSPMPADTQTVQVAVIPARSSDDQKKQLESLAAYLQKTLNRPVNVQLTKNYDAAVDLLVGEKVEMAYLGPLTYLKARERNTNLEPLVLPIEQTSGRPWYTSVIVADTTKGIKALSDLNGKRFAFVSPSSTSGFLMAMDGLQKQNINPTQNFSSIRYSGSHDKAIADLTKGTVDAIAVEKAIFLKAKQKGNLGSSRYQMIWESEPIPTTPIVVNTTKFSPETLLQLKQALIDAPDGLVDVHGSNSQGYTIGKDSDFETIRQIYLRLKTVTVPEK